MLYSKKSKIGIGLVTLVSAFFALYSIKSDLKPPIKLTKRQAFIRDSIHFEDLIVRGNEYYSKRNQLDNVKTSLIYFDSALFIAKKLKNAELIAKGHYFIGNVRTYP